MNGVMDVLKAAIAYWGMVFGCGFVLGTVRTLWLLPLVGSRSAELLEMPLMGTAIALSSRWIVHRFPQLDTAAKQVAVGLVALGLMLVAEIGVGVGLRGLSVVDSLWNRDPIAGTAYYLLLAVFALLPWLWAVGGATNAPSQAGSVHQPNSHSD